MSYLSTRGIIILVIAIGLLQSSATQLSATSYTENNGQLADHVYFLNYITIYINLIFFPIHFFMKKREEAEQSELQKSRLIAVASSPNNHQEMNNGDNDLMNSSSTPVENSNKISYATNSNNTNTSMTNDDGENNDNTSRQTTNHHRPTSRSFTELAGIVVFLYFCYVVANGAYSVALSVGTRPSITASIFAICPVFVVFLSWFVLKIKPLFIHWIALVAGVTGVLVVLQPWKVTSLFSDASSSSSSSPTSSASSSNSETLLAIIASILSPIFAALYKVYFSKFFQNSKWHEAGKILGYLTIPNLFIGTTLITIVLTTTNIEVSPFLPSSSASDNHNNNNNNNSTSASFADVPASTWWVFVAARIFGLAFNVVVNWGVTVVPPLYVSVGTILSTMCNIFADAMLGRGWPDPIAWFGMGLIIISFICVAVSGRFVKKSDENDDDENNSNNNKNKAEGSELRFSSTTIPISQDIMLVGDDDEGDDRESSSSTRSKNSKSSKSVKRSKVVRVSDLEGADPMEI